MDYFLIDNPPHQRQYKDRGTTPSGVIVVHTAESAPDWIGPDTGAEGVARFIQGRSDFGCYHALADSDSIVPLVPPWLQTYGDGTGSNPHAWHVSGATQAAKWDAAPKVWREETARNMGTAAGRYALWLKSEHGIDVPARRITKSESDRRVPGFISHGERDPGRRSDPGTNFPWALFLAAFEAVVAPKKPVETTPLITAAFEAKNESSRRAALRKLVRHNDEDVAAAAQRWITGMDRRDRAEARIKAARTDLRRLEKKEK